MPPLAPQPGQLALGELSGSDIGPLHRLFKAATAAAELPQLAVTDRAH